MVYAHKLHECETACIEPLPDDYIDQYLEMHSNDVYWTGEKVINATDGFKIFVAVENGIVPCVA